MFWNQKSLFKFSSWRCIYNHKDNFLIKLFITTKIFFSLSCWVEVEWSWSWNVLGPGARQSIQSLQSRKTTQEFLEDWVFPCYQIGHKYHHDNKEYQFELSQLNVCRIFNLIIRGAKYSKGGQECRAKFSKSGDEKSPISESWNQERHYRQLSIRITEEWKLTKYSDRWKSKAWAYTSARNGMPRKERMLSRFDWLEPDTALWLIRICFVVDALA